MFSIKTQVVTHWNHPTENSIMGACKIFLTLLFIISKLFSLRLITLSYENFAPIFHKNMLWLLAKLHASIMAFLIKHLQQDFMKKVMKRSQNHPQSGLSLR